MEEFGTRKASNDGKAYICKPCKQESDRLWRVNNREVKLRRDREYTKKHAEANRQRASKWYYENLQTAKATRRRYFENHRLEHYQANRKWCSSHLDAVQKYKREWCKTKYTTDKAYRLKVLLANRLRDCVKNKPDKTMSLLGCTATHFMDWIQFQFDDLMTWENMGTYWALDHVKPCAAFDLSIKAEVQACFHWTNIRPCEARENMSKGSKILPGLIAVHDKLVQTFLEHPSGVPSVIRNDYVAESKEL